MKTFYEIGIALSEDPIVWQFDNFLSSEECRHFITVARDNMQRSVLGEPGKQRPTDYRTGNMHWINKHHDSITTAVAQRMSNLVDIPVDNAESFQILRYEVGEEYRPHMDAFDPNTPIGKSSFDRGGQRVLTCLFYLSDVDEGGGTCFPELNLNVKPEIGRLIIFHNTRLGSSIDRDPRLLHGGLPVLAGEKWACSFWFHSEKWS